MHRISSFGVIALLLLMVASCSKTSAPRRGGLYGEAMDKVDAYQFNEADSLLAKLAETDSLGFNTTYGKGVSYEHQMMYYDALLSYLITVSHFPDSSVVDEALNRVFTYLDSPEEAVEAARRWSELEKGNTLARFLMIRAQINSGMYRRAEQSLTEALKVGLDKGLGELLKARLQVISHLFDDAAASAAQGRTQGTETPDLMLALADYYEERGLIDSCIMAGARSYELGQNQFYGFLQFQRCLKHSYFVAARKYVAEMAAKDKSRIPTTVLALFYRRAADDRDQLYNLADSLSLLRPAFYSTFFFNAEAYRAIGDMSFVAMNVASARALADDKGVHPPFKDFVHWEIIKRIVWPYPPMEIRAQLDSLKGWREALPRFQIMSAGELLADTSQKPFDVRIDSLLNANAQNPYWLIRAGQTLSEATGRGAVKGNMMYRQALKVDPQLAEAVFGMVKNAMREYKFSDAEAVFAEFPGFADRYPEAGMMKALCDVIVGKTADGMSAFEKSFPMVKGEINAAEAVAQELVQRGKAEEAKRVTAECTELSPDNADALLLACDIHYQLGNYQASRDCAERGLKLEPQNPYLVAYRGRAMYALGEKDEAKKIFEDVLKKSPSDQAASMVYSRILADENTDPSRAQNLGRQALLYGKLSMRPTINLAYVYYKGGRYDLAMGAAQAATVTFPDDPEAFYWLGMSQFSGKREGAKGNLQKAVELGLVGDELQMARQTLSKL